MHGFDVPLIEALDPVLRNAVFACPDARVFQFLVEAEPAPGPLGEPSQYQALVKRSVPSAPVVSAGTADAPPNGTSPPTRPAELLKPLLGRTTDAVPPLFDSSYYLSVYPDVAAAGFDAYLHYIHFGAAEGRNPHPLFHTSYYVESHKDVAESGVNPLLHYCESGAEQGWDPHPLFDTAYYAGQAKLAGTGKNALLHYCTSGFRSGLSPHPLFDLRLYLGQCPEVDAGSEDPLANFLSRHGAKTPRPHMLFDPVYYLRENLDVAAAPINAFLHYMLRGWRENRNPHPLFDGPSYRAQLDGVDDSTCPLDHYIRKGSRIGLKPHPWFDGQFYLEKYPEVADCGESALAHYLHLGYRLNYSPNTFFNWPAYLERNADKIPSGMSPLEHVIEHGDGDGGTTLVSMHTAVTRAGVLDAAKSMDKSRAKLIAFYLPQYHPIEENDRWWGKGFTDWRNVARATPLFQGHYQPRIPADLGFYDLRLPEILEQQAGLAKEHGIHGFCFYYYWFDGHRLLERPLEQMLARNSPQFPFCICWANEHWSRRWDGSPHEILIEQRYSSDFAERFIRDVIPILTAPNYIRVAGAPLLLVCRIDLMPDVLRVTETWRRVFRQRTGLELHLTMLEDRRILDSRLMGFDSTSEFSPRIRSTAFKLSDIPGLCSEFQGRIEDYRTITRRALLRPPTDFAFYRCVMTGWDNAARFGLRARILIEQDLVAYEGWLRSVVKLSLADKEKQEPLVFIFAWNEWAEGAYLEPDQMYGHAYLRATRKALCEGV